MANTPQTSQVDLKKSHQFLLLPVDQNNSRLTQLIKTYLPKKEVDKVWEAYRFSEKAHSGQKRRSGEAYISHPVSVACIAARFHLDSQSIQAALLHDVVEDTQVTESDIELKFGKQVSILVTGLSKLDKVEFQDANEAQAENFRKMLLAMTQDVRVMLIKLSDRLHNMQTIQSLDESRKIRIAQETVDIYAPIANRLGLNNLYQELEDLCFEVLHPVRYKTIQKAIKASRGNRKEVIEKISNEISNKLNSVKTKSEITGREKNPASIHRKMLEDQTGFNQINDIYAFRIIVNDINDCYLTLGTLHSLYNPIPGKFKDYIAIPKANGYQSLHSTLLGPFGVPVEIQIRTKNMHQLAEAGVAAHWLYKTKDAHVTDLQQKTNQWLKRMLEIQNDSSNSLEFLEHLKVDLFPDEVYVFSPDGKIFALPKNSSTIDFAYAVHSDVGNKAVSAKINQILVPLRTKLSTGDHVEIITSTLAKPNPTWLNFVITGKARSQIRNYLRSAESKDLIFLGEKMLNNALNAFHIHPTAIKKKHWNKLILDYHVESKDEILMDIALGKKVNVMVAHQLTNLMDGVASNKKQTKMLDVITIKGSDDMAIQLANCCHPIPGDPILGYINKDKGLVIHTHDCKIVNELSLEHDRWVDVEWEPDSEKLFNVRLSVLVVNERGMLGKIASVIADAESNIDNVSLQDMDGSPFATLNFVVQVRHRLHLAELIRNLRKITKVNKITRVKNYKN
ncbi:bifunctional (p)ppGpp synthetase/guanosine-3',5'-bis(diphosphate) 3'-pyrophosphohydrolase [Methylophilaceae bacterium]|nr:bifunctional (p)ppGpp synthetase/guanosine-3',5'-bis(diphosphate) 3'-pyrophosphohydrolase [Methylophilaceae bacterium]